MALTDGVKTKAQLFIDQLELTPARRKGTSAPQMTEVGAQGERTRLIEL